MRGNTIRKHLKGYWIIVACACIIVGEFFYTIQCADYVYDYKIVPGREAVTLSYLQDDGSQNKIKCYGNVLETQGVMYQYKIQKENHFMPGYDGVWLSKPGTGKDFSPVYAYDSEQHQHIEWHSKTNDSFSHGSVTTLEDGTGMSWEEPSSKMDIACAAVVYSRIKLLQKVLVGYAVFEAILFMIGYVLYKKPETICNLLHKEQTVYHIKIMRWVGCILPLCGAVAIFLIRLVVS